MKTNSLLSKLTLLFLSSVWAINLTGAEPKKVLVVTVTTGFRHSSIPTAEKIIAQIGQDSGAFTVVDYARQPSVKVPQKPNTPQKPKEPTADAGEGAQAKYKADLAKFEAAQVKFKADLEKWNASQAEVKAAQADYDKALKESLAKLSPENLKNFDGVIFANTTGDLPLPDKQGFIDWVNAGHAFIAMHSGSDTFHGFRPFIDMLGGEFETHGAQVSVDCVNRDKAHPAANHFGDKFTVFDEIYIIKSYNKAKVHELLSLDSHPNSKQPGHYAVSWCKQFGQGKVFYTSLGHREDVWDTNEKNRKNPAEVSEAYQKHILGGIKWALGLEKGDATPGN